MTKQEAIDRFKISPSWLLANGSNFAIWGGIVWFFLWPAIQVRAQDYLESEVKRIVPMRVSEQVEKRLEALEKATDDLAKTQKTIVYQVGEVNKTLPEVKGNIDTIIRMLRDTEDTRGRRQ